MPTGTFLTFQLLAPLTTLVPDKNGTCGIMQYVRHGAPPAQHFATVQSCFSLRWSLQSMLTIAA